MILSYYIGLKYLFSVFWSFLAIFFLILLVDGSDQIVSMSSQGHNFIVGLANHYRNLLVCKDERTAEPKRASE